MTQSTLGRAALLVSLGLVGAGCKKVPNELEPTLAAIRRKSSCRHSGPATSARTDLRIVKPVSGGPAGATVEVTVIVAKK